MQWNDDNTITVTPPKKPKKVTGTRFASVLDLNRWSSPFEAWCAITRTYEEPFVDTIYTIAGKTIEPKQADYIQDLMFWEKMVRPADIWGEDYFRKTWGDFFPNTKIFGGMWDYLSTDSAGKPTTVLEMKTTKRVEDWADDIPEYYAMQAALYAYLLDVDRVIMVCTVLEDRDYENPENFKVNVSNTFTREFLVSERYPDMAKTIRKVKKWWKDHVVSGISPVYDEKRDAEILKALRANTVNPETDVAELVREAEEIQTRLDEVAEQTAEDVKRLKVLKDQIKEVAQGQFREGDKEVIIPGSRYNWVTSVSVRTGFDEAKMKADGVLDKYKTKETVTYRLTNKAKED